MPMRVLLPCLLKRQVSCLKLGLEFDGSRSGRKWLGSRGLVLSKRAGIIRGRLVKLRVFDRLASLKIRNNIDCRSV